MKLKTNLLRSFGAITRVDKENRIVEGYCFVNEECGDGWKLKRSSMEDATDDYLKWGATREMHRNDSAAGTANDGSNPELGVFWDDNGALFRTKVSDDAAWKKVEEGVYKGFSVGVQPLVCRGKEVQKCKWIEVSLVDRPADPDAVFMSIGRADGYNGETEFEAEFEDEEINRGAFADQIKANEKYALRRCAWELLDAILWDIQYSSEGDRAMAVRTACQEFADYIAPIIARGEFGGTDMLPRLAALAATGGTAELTRLQGANSELLTRIEKAEAEVERLALVETAHNGAIERFQAVMAKVEGETNEALIDRVETALKSPSAQDKPLKVTCTAEGIVKRVTSVNSDEEELTRRQTAINRQNEILATDWSGSSPTEKRDALRELEEIKQVLAG